MELILSVVCDDARVRPDGKLDLTGIFTQLQAPGFPASQGAMTAVFVIEWSSADTGRQPLRAELKDDAGETVLTIEGHTDVTGAPAGAPAALTRLIMPLENVVFPHAGNYHFQITVADQVRRGCAVHVGAATETEPASGPAAG